MSAPTILDELRATVEAVWAGDADLRERVAAAAIEETIALLDRGEVRAASPSEAGWTVNDWVKMAVLLYFRLRGAQPIHAGDLEFFDKVPLKRNLEAAGVRVVPPAVARFGSFLGRGVVLMPSFVNIGAHVGEETMVDTWATVGSCAQIGARVHLSGGVGIGGVLEPVQARPVIVEDGAFIGSRSIVVEGAVVGAGAVLGAGVVLTGSTPVIDVRGAEPVESRGAVPARGVVIPGMRQKQFPAGTFGTPAALVIGTRTEATDAKVGLNATLREYGVDV